MAGAAHRERVTPAKRVCWKDGATSWLGSGRCRHFDLLSLSFFFVECTNLSRIFLFDVRAYISFGLSD